MLHNSWYSKVIKQNLLTIFWEFYNIKLHTDQMKKYNRTCLPEKLIRQNRPEKPKMTSMKNMTYYTKEPIYTQRKRTARFLLKVTCTLRIISSYIDSKMLVRGYSLKYVYSISKFEIYIWLVLFCFFGRGLFLFLFCFVLFCFLFFVFCFL